MKGPWSITYELCMPGLAGYAWHAIDVMIAHLQCLTPSTTTAGQDCCQLGEKVPSKLVPSE